MPVGNSTHVDFRTAAKYHPHPMDSVEIMNIIEVNNIHLNYILLQTYTGFELIAN